MSSIKLIVGAIALATAMICVSYAETTVTLPDVNAKIYGKLNYMAYYNEDTSGNVYGSLATMLQELVYQLKKLLI